MLYKYLSYNFLKYSIYAFIICIGLLANLYLEIDLQLLIIGILIAMLIDIIYGMYTYINLEKNIKKIKEGKFNKEGGYTNFYEELIFLTIKRLTDEYLLEMKKLEQATDEYNEYIELWIHEMKLSLANVKHMISSYDNIYLESELESLNDNIERVIAIIKSQETEVNSNFEEAEVSFICNSAIKLQMANLIANNINIKTDYDDSVVVCDKYWLIFVIKQILNNSIKYGANEIEVICDKQKIIISDNGVGIEESELNLVFQKFYCSTKTKENIKSTGIGLYLVKNILDKYGFTIKLESQDKGLKTIIDLTKRIDLTKKED